MSSADRLLRELSSEQHGVFTTAQARRAGVPHSTIATRVAGGEYVRRHRGVYSLAGIDFSWHAEVIAGVFSVRGLAAASHRTAAFLWGMSGIRPDVVEVVAIRHRRVTPRGLTVHESVDLIDGHIATVDGIPVTHAIRTVVDLGASASSRYVEHCLDTGLRMSLFDVYSVGRFMRRVAKSGRNGIGAIRPLIEDREAWAIQTESTLEDRFTSLVRRSSVRPPVPQYEVRDESGAFVCRADFAYPDRRILIELDSERYHMDHAAFQGDRDKQNRAQQLGWTVYRFTWKQLSDDPEGVLSLLALLTTDIRS